MNLDFYYLAFIDVLGFSKMVEHDCNGPGDNQKFFEKLLAINKTITSLQSDGYKIESIQFSDSTIIFTKFDKNKLKPFVEVVRKYQQLLFHEGLLCRGAISHGKHYHENGFIFSQALVDAYRLEQGAAIYPRIIVSNDLIDLLLPGKNVVEELGLLRSKDGYYFVDYIKSVPIEIVKKFIDVENRNIEKYDLRTKEKIFWIFDYMSYIYPEIETAKVPSFLND
jgi:hypothetical protein